MKQLPDDVSSAERAKVYHKESPGAFAFATPTPQLHSPAPVT